jgi:hypothetical protein
MLPVNDQLCAVALEVAPKNQGDKNEPQFGVNSSHGRESFPDVGERT